MSLFVLFDWFGRSSTRFKILINNISLKVALMLILTRLVFYALFSLEALPKYSYDDLGNVVESPIISSDVVSCLTMIVFAYSNGLLSSIVMIKYSSLIKDQGDLALAGNF